MSFSAEALNAVDALPQWDMIEVVGEDLVVEQNSSVTIGDPSVNDFSYDGALSFGGISSPPAEGSLVDEGNGTWTYTPAPDFTGKDALSYTVSNAFGNVFTGTLSISVTAAENFPAIEAGNIEAGTSGWIEVELDRSFASPVVIAQPVLAPDTPPLVSRVRNAAGRSFELLLQRADGQAGDVDSIQVQYVVVEEGVYNPDDHGIKMEAVKVASSRTDSAGNFEGQAATLAHDNWDHYYIPTFFGQVMSFNDSAWSTFWASGGASGYTIGKHVGEDPATSRADETLGYVVMGSRLVANRRLPLPGRRARLRCLRRLQPRLQRRHRAQFRAHAGALGRARPGPGAGGRRGRVLDRVGRPGGRGQSGPGAPARGLDR